MEQNDVGKQAGQTIIIQQAPAPQSNGLGISGFVLALLGLIFCWVPILGWILWILGLVFSICGMFKKPKGFAIAGLCISLIGLIFLILVMGAMAAVIATT